MVSVWLSVPGAPLPGVVLPGADTLQVRYLEDVHVRETFPPMKNQIQTMFWRRATVTKT